MGQVVPAVSLDDGHVVQAAEEHHLAVVDDGHRGGDAGAQLLKQPGPAVHLHDEVDLGMGVEHVAECRVERDVEVAQMPPRLALVRIAHGDELHVRHEFPEGVVGDDVQQHPQPRADADYAHQKRPHGTVPVARVRIVVGRLAH
jgi:hypothetical protein